MGPTIQIQRLPRRKRKPAIKRALFFLAVAILAAQAIAFI
jgi:hypothetical protein